MKVDITDLVVELCQRLEVDPNEVERLEIWPSSVILDTRVRWRDGQIVGHARSELPVELHVASPERKP